MQLFQSFVDSFTVFYMHPMFLNQIHKIWPSVSLLQGTSKHFFASICCESILGIWDKSRFSFNINTFDKVEFFYMLSDTHANHFCRWSKTCGESLKKIETR